MTAIRLFTRLPPIALAAVASMLGVPSARADSYTFFSITNNRSRDSAVGEAQLRLDVEAVGAGQVRFTFTNIGPAPSSITDVYFDNGSRFLGDGSLGSIDTIIDADEGGDSDVHFSRFASPFNLPGAELASPPFQATLGFSADSDGFTRGATIANGVQPGDVLSIVFDLRDGSVFSDVLAELASAELRVGVQVRGFRGRRLTRGRESFINESLVTDVPEPSPLPAVGAGLLLIALWRRR